MRLEPMGKRMAGRKSVGRFVSATLLAVCIAACSDSRPPAAPTGPTNQVGTYTISPPNGTLSGPTGTIAFSIYVECAGSYVTGTSAIRDDGQSVYLGIFLPCRTQMSEYHAASEDFYTAVWNLGQGGHDVSLGIVIGIDEAAIRAGNVLYRSPKLATWHVP
jgi:hypothetical protein